jgi:hypothetical protein
MAAPPKGCPSPQAFRPRLAWGDTHIRIQTIMPWDRGMRPEDEWFELEAAAVAAGPVDWRAIFECVDRRGRLVDRTGEQEIRHRIPGAHPVSPGMASIGWYMAGKLANFDDGTRAGRPGSKIPGGDIYGGWRRLTVACDLHKATVIRCRRQLRQAGWIRLTRPAGLDGMPRGFSSVYQLTIPHMYGEFTAARLMPATDIALAGDVLIPRGRHARA